MRERRAGRNRRDQRLRLGRCCGMKPDSSHILIVGCGAIGGLFAAALSSVAKVTAFDTNGEHAQAINTQGLRVIGKNPRTVRIAATSDPASLKNTAFAAVIFLTKSKNTTPAPEQLRQ